MKKPLIALGLALILTGVGATTLGLRNREKPSFGTTTISYNGHKYEATYLKRGLNLFHPYESEGIPNPLFLNYSAGDFGVGGIDERTLHFLAGIEEGFNPSREEFRESIRKGLNEVLGVGGGTIINLDKFR